MYVCSAVCVFIGVLGCAWNIIYYLLLLFVITYDLYVS